jgi:hypothetical protein
MLILEAYCDIVLVLILWKNTGADEAMPALIEPVLTSRAFRKNWASLVSIS